MVEKNNDDKRHSMRNQKRTQRQERTCRRLKIPPPPQWIEAKIADLEGSSRLRLLYNANDFDALRQDPIGLSNLAHLTTNSLLPLPHPEWRQCGFTVLRDEGIVVPGLGTLTSVRWLLAVEWSPSHSAWDALLFSLDHLRLKAFALPHTFVLPTFFLISMAGRPDDMLLPTTMASWGPVLHETCQVLAPLLQALYECWIDGPSQAAFRYRQFIEYRPAEAPSEEHILAPFRRVVGSDGFNAIQSSEQFEATLLRQLRQVSRRLWTKECLPLPEQEVSRLLTTSHLSALLPLALWQSSLPVPVDADVTHLHSLDAVFQLWQQQMAVE